MAIEVQTEEKISKPLSLQSSEPYRPIVSGVTTTGKLIIEELPCFSDYCQPPSECMLTPTFCPGKINIELPIKDNSDLEVLCSSGKVVRVLSSNLQMALYGKPTGDGSPSPYFLIQREKASQRTDH